MLMRPQGRDWRGVMAAGVAAAVPFLAYGIWFVSHPDTFLDTLRTLGDSPGAHPLARGTACWRVTNWAVLARRAADYWSYLNPTFLFDGSAVFGVGMALLLGAGWWSRTRAHTRWRSLTAGLLARPARRGPARSAARRGTRADDGAAGRAPRRQRRRVAARSAAPPRRQPVAARARGARRGANSRRRPRSAVGGASTLIRGEAGEGSGR